MKCAARRGLPDFVVVFTITTAIRAGRCHCCCVYRFHYGYGYRYRRI